MKDNNSLPLLLLDNSSMMSVLNEGEFKCFNLTFEEAKHILEIHDEKMSCAALTILTLKQLSLIILDAPSAILNISIFVICAGQRCDSF